MNKAVNLEQFHVFPVAVFKGSAVAGNADVMNGCALTLLMQGAF